MARQGSGRRDDSPSPSSRPISELQNLGTPRRVGRRSNADLRISCCLLWNAANRRAGRPVRQGGPASSQRIKAARTALASLPARDPTHFSVAHRRIGFGHERHLQAAQYRPAWSHTHPSTLPVRSLSARVPFDPSLPQARTSLIPSHLTALPSSSFLAVVPLFRPSGRLPLGSSQPEHQAQRRFLRHQSSHIRFMLDTARGRTWPCNHRPSST